MSGRELRASAAGGCSPLDLFKAEILNSGPPTSFEFDPDDQPAAETIRYAKQNENSRPTNRTAAVSGSHPD